MATNNAINTGKPIEVANGGTGAATFTDAGVLIGNGTGVVQVTTAGTAGQVLTSNGAGVDPTFQTAGGGTGAGTVTVAKAGESLAIRDAIVLVNDLDQGIRSNSNNGGPENMGDTTRQQIACKILSRETITSTQIVLRMAKFNSPTDNVFIEVQGDSAGSPDGTAITNGTSTNVAGSGLPNDATTSNGSVYSQTTFTFSSAFTITAGTTYWIVVKRSGSQDGTNYYKIDHSPEGAYANFSAKYYTGSAWTSNTNPMYFRVNLATGTPSIRAYKANNSIVAISRVDGFATAAASADATFTYQTGGEMSGFSSLTPGTTYFNSSTAGQITDTQGTYGGRIGKAITASVIAIDLGNECRVYGKNLAYNTGISSTVFVPTGFRMSRIQAFSSFAGTGAKMSAGASNGTNGYMYNFDSTGVSASSSAASQTTVITDNGHITTTVSVVTEYGIELTFSTSVTGSGQQVYDVIR